MIPIRMDMKASFFLLFVSLDGYDTFRHPLQSHARQATCVYIYTHHESMTAILPYKKVTVSIDSYSIEFMFLVNPSHWIPTELYLFIPFKCCYNTVVFITLTCQ